MAFSLWNWRLPPPNTTTFSNFQSFVDSVTPTVPNIFATEAFLKPYLLAYIQLKSIMLHVCNPYPLFRFPQLWGVGKRARGGDSTSCFRLCDLWSSYLQKSAYGAGVPILLDSGESIMQYYSPSLSAIQIYTREPFNSKSESHNVHMPLSSIPSRTLNTTSDDTIIDETRDRFGYLYFQYNETSSPYDRLPLYKKISELASSNHGLENFKSVDLSPYSWVAIAWYPISQIPVVGNKKDLAACFITYHTLSTCSQGLEHTLGTPGRDQIFPRGMAFKLEGSRGEKVALPPFAISTYKMFGGLWQNPRTSDHVNTTFYRRAAVSWLRELGFQHSDFNFFSSR